MSALDFLLSREWSLVLAAACLVDALLVYARLRRDHLMRQFIREAVGIIVITVLFAAVLVYAAFEPHEREIRITFRFALWFAFTNILVANLVALLRDKRRR